MRVIIESFWQIISQFPDFLARLTITLCFLTISILLSAQDIYQYALRQEIIKSNNIKSVCVLGSKEDAVCATFDKNGKELTGEFFLKDSSNIRPPYNPKPEEIFKDSLGRIIKIIQPEPYIFSELTYEYLDKIVIERRYYRNQNKLAQTITKYYDSNKNLIKEVRQFSDGVELVFKYRYDKSNLLKTIVNADRSTLNLKYSFWQ